MRFLIKAMINSDVQWNESEEKWEQLEKPILVNPCGSEYQRFVSDLKTISGVKKRIAGVKWPSDVVELKIYATYNGSLDDKLLETMKIS